MAQPQQSEGGEKPPLRVGMVGYAFMGAAHSQGWRTVGRVFDLPRRPVLAAICGRDPDAVRAAADRHGWAAAETDWRALIARDDVDLVDICTPGDGDLGVTVAGCADVDEVDVVPLDQHPPVGLGGGPAVPVGGPAHGVRVPSADRGEHRAAGQVEDASDGPPALGVGGAHEGVADHADPERRHLGLF